MQFKYLMTVGSKQGYDLRDLNEKIDPPKDPNPDQARVYDRKQELYSILGSDQIVWCAQKEISLSWVDDDARVYIHRILVDERDIAMILDSLVWNHIINTDERYILPEDHIHLRQKSQIDEAGYEIALKRLEDEYLATRLPSDGNLWGNLGRNDDPKDSDQILLRFPFQYDSEISMIEVITSDELEKKSSSGSYRVKI